MQRYKDAIFRIFDKKKTFKTYNLISYCIQSIND